MFNRKQILFTVTIAEHYRQRIVQLTMLKVITKVPIYMSDKNYFSSTVWDKSLVYKQSLIYLFNIWEIIVKRSLSLFIEKVIKNPQQSILKKSFPKFVGVFYPNSNWLIYFRC